MPHCTLHNAHGCSTWRSKPQDRRRSFVDLFVSPQMARTRQTVRKLNVKVEFSSAPDGHTLLHCETYLSGDSCHWCLSEERAIREQTKEVALEERKAYQSSFEKRMLAKKQTLQNTVERLKQEIVNLERKKRDTEAYFETEQNLFHLNIIALFTNTATFPTHLVDEKSIQNEGARGDELKKKDEEEEEEEKAKSSKPLIKGKKRKNNQLEGKDKSKGKGKAKGASSQGQKVKKGKKSKRS